MGKTWREQLEAKAKAREERVNRLGRFYSIIAQDVVRLNIRQAAIEREIQEKGVLTKEDYEAITTAVAEEFQKKSEGQSSTDPASTTEPVALAAV